MASSRSQPVTGRIALLAFLGVDAAPRFHRDPLFWVATGIGALISFGLVFLLAPDRLVRNWASIVLLQPVLEELLFRGVIQGQLRTTA